MVVHCRCLLILMTKRKQTHRSRCNARLTAVAACEHCCLDIELRYVLCADNQLYIHLQDASCLIVLDTVRDQCYTHCRKLCMLHASCVADAALSATQYNAMMSGIHYSTKRTALSTVHNAVNSDSDTTLMATSPSSSIPVLT
jgi:hypothetical protein